MRQNPFSAPVDTCAVRVAARLPRPVPGSMSWMGPPTRPERTPDGRYIVVKGRRWRATDPEIPEHIAADLRRHLMAARRAVGAARRSKDEAAEGLARSRVHTAKVALGERGTPWWDQSLAQRRERWTKGVTELEAAEGGRARG